MYEFIQQVRDLLVAMGVNNITTYGYSITVGGHEFNCMRRGIAKSVRVNPPYIGSRLCRTPQAAVQFIISSLPEITEMERKEAEESKRCRERRAKHTKLNNECLAINDRIAGTNCSVGGNIDTDIYSLTFNHKDKSTILAAIDYLQEGGFCEVNADKMSEEGFLIKQVNLLIAHMNQEQKRTVLEHLSNYLEEKEQEVKEDLTEIGGES